MMKEPYTTPLFIAMFVGWPCCSVRVEVGWMPFHSCLPHSLRTDWGFGHWLLHSSAKWGYSVADKICPVRIDCMSSSLLVLLPVYVCFFVSCCVCLCVRVGVLFSDSWLSILYHVTLAVSCPRLHVSQVVAYGVSVLDDWFLTRLRKLILLSRPPFVYVKYCNRVWFHLQGLHVK